MKSLYPDHDGYLDVYHQYGLTGKNCVFAHCVHLEEKEWDRLSETKSSIAFCPTSNRQRLIQLEKSMAEES